MQLEVAGTHKWPFASVVPFETQTGPKVFVHGADLTAQRRVTEALAASEESLRQRTQALEERNVALRVLIDQKREDAEQLLQSVTNNIEQLVVPTLNLLESALRDRAEVALVEAARLTLAEVARPLIRRPNQSEADSSHLRQREYQVLQLIRTGRTTDEIADVLCPSPATIAFHRNNVRRKLGLYGTGHRLAPRVAVDGLRPKQNGRETTEALEDSRLSG